MGTFEDGTKPVSLAIIGQNGYTLFYKIFNPPGSRLKFAENGFHGIDREAITSLGVNPAYYRCEIEKLIANCALIGFDVTNDIKVVDTFFSLS